MKRKPRWAVMPKLELRLKLQNESLASETDEAIPLELQAAVCKVLEEKGLGKHAGTETAGGRTSILFEGVSPGAMAHAIEDVVAQFRARRPIVLVLREGELARHSVLSRGAPYVESPATMIVTMRIGKNDRMRPKEIEITGALQRRVDEVLQKADAGWLDGDGFGGESLDIFCYGHEADSLWETVECLFDPFVERDLVVHLIPARIGFDRKCGDFAEDLHERMFFDELERM